MYVYCQGLCPPIFMDYISPIVKDYGRLMKKNMPTYFQDCFRQPSRIMFTYCQVLCTPTVKDYFRIMSRIRSADCPRIISDNCQGLCLPTVKDYVRPLSRITSAYSQRCSRLCLDYISPIVKDYGRLDEKEYVHLLSGLFFANHLGLCPPTVKDHVHLLSEIMSTYCQGTMITYCQGSLYAYCK